MTDESKIKLFAEHALRNVTIDGVYRPEGYGTYASKTFVDKFAELIVRDCLKQMDNGDLDFAIWKIKKDYGIE